MTLSAGTSVQLIKHAKRASRPRAAFAREQLSTALEQLDREERSRKLEADYVAGWDDALEIMADMQDAQVEHPE